MALKSGDKITAHTRLAVPVPAAKDFPTGFALFTPGEAITIGKAVSLEQAQAWLDCGSAGPFVPPAV